MESEGVRANRVDKWALTVVWKECSADQICVLLIAAEKLITLNLLVVSKMTITGNSQEERFYNGDTRNVNCVFAKCAREVRYRTLQTSSSLFRIPNANRSTSGQRFSLVLKHFKCGISKFPSVITKLHSRSEWRVLHKRLNLCRKDAKYSTTVRKLCIVIMLKLTYYCTITYLSSTLFTEFNVTL